MKVLLTGGTGFVGSTMRERLRAAGHDVRLLVRRDSANKIPNSTDYDIIYGDIFETNTVLRACVGMDAIVNLIGIIREVPEQGIMFDQYHRAAVENLLEAARIENVARIIHMSALGSSENAKSLYHRSKWQGEELIRNSDMRWTIFRPSWIFAPGDNLSIQITELLQMPIVPFIDGGKYEMQPISREDVVEVMTRSLEMPETQGKTYELGGSESVAFADVVERFAVQDGITMRSMNVPSWAIRPVVQVMQRFAFFPVTVDQLRMLSEDNTCNNLPFVKTFGVQPKSFKDALPQLATAAAKAAA